MMKTTTNRISKATTIIGLVFEGLSLAAIAFATSLLAILYRADKADVEEILVDANLTTAEIEEFMDLFGTFQGWIPFLLVPMIVFGLVLFVIFLVNLVLFTGVLRSRYSVDKAGKIYLYQAIWGAINLLFNQLLGILYLVSGIQGRSQMNEERRKTGKDTGL